MYDFIENATFDTKKKTIVEANCKKNFMDKIQ